jgi:hypothetical protein
MNGKGDSPRPLSVNRKAFEDNWDRIFTSIEKKLLDELTQISQEMGLYDAPERSEVESGKHPGMDDDGNGIEHTAC